MLRYMRVFLRSGMISISRPWLDLISGGPHLIGQKTLSDTVGASLIRQLLREPNSSRAILNRMAITYTNDDQSF